MIWLIIAYLLGLIYFTANLSKVVDRRRFRTAWTLLAIIPMVSGVFTFLRAFTVGSARSMAVIEIIGNSLSWGLLGFSLLLFTRAVLPTDTQDA